MSLMLHPKKGVNPHLCFCTRCGGDTNEIALLGIHDSVYRCRCCNVKVIGHGLCPQCRGVTEKLRSLEENERIPGRLCGPCEEEVKQFAEIVAAGGVYWKCPGGHSGVIKAESEYAQVVRKHMKIEPPNPVGVELTIEQCLKCQEEATNGGLRKAAA